MRFFIKLDHSLLLVFFLDYHPLYWKCLIHYMNIQWHYLLLPTIYEWNVKKPRWITRLSRYSMRCTIFNRSWKYFRWRYKGYVQSACNAFFLCLFLYIIYSICSIRKSLQQHFFTNSEAVTRGVLWKNAFFEISLNLQENTCARASACNFIKKRL